MRMDHEYRMVAAQDLRDPRVFFEALGYWPAAGAEGAASELTQPSPGRRLLGRALAGAAVAAVLLLTMAGASLI